VKSVNREKLLSETERADLQYFSDLCTMVSAKRSANLLKIKHLHKFARSVKVGTVIKFC